MKYLKLIVLVFISKVVVFAQSTEGVKFIHDDYKTAIAQARTERKLIFWDAYTTWCGPCKLMTRNTFPDAQVSEYFNKNFVNLKMDMEKGEGPELLKKYNIAAFPTLLFINGDGKLVHKALGYHDPTQFLELGKTVLGGDNSLEKWEKRYTDGERTPQFLREYALKLQETLEPKRFQVADDYLKTQSDSASSENLEFILRFIEDVDSKYLPFLIRNKSKFASPEEIEMRIGELVTTRLFDPKNLPTLEYADKLLRMTYPDKFDRLSMKYRMEHGRLSNNLKDYTKAGGNYFKKYHDVATEMSDAANNLISMTDKKKYLKKAVKWAEQAVKIEKTYINQLTVAQAYDKMSKKSKALAAAEEAIKIAKASSESSKEAAEIVKRLRITK